MVDSMHQAHPDLTDQIKEAFQHWDKPYRDASPLTDSLVFKEINPTPVSNPRGALNKMLLSLLDDFQGDNTLFADTLRMRYADGRTVRETANYFNVEEGTVQKRQAAGWDEAARLLEQKEEVLRSHIRLHLIEKLESPTYTKLWGVDKHIQTLTELLTDPNGPRIIAIEGIGGIGKTSLTNGLMRHLIQNDIIGGKLFDDCAWVTARTSSLGIGGTTTSYPQATITSSGLIHNMMAQLFTEEGTPMGLDEEQLLSMLSYRLAESPHLIVVDNLESIEDVDSLIATLKQLIEPSKIILTTRHNLFHHPDVYHYAIRQIDEPDALQLIRHEATRSNIQLLADASDEELRPIYNTVGGNPLALRLVVGQTHIHSLHHVLNDLIEAKGKPIESLYTYIYWNAWNTLDESARQAWLLMPLVNGSGMSVARLAEFSEMEADDLRNAIDQLVTLNLIEHQSDLFESRYFIHSLTRSFLQGQVLKWGEAEPAVG